MRTSCARWDAAWRSTSTDGKGAKGKEERPEMFKIESDTRRLKHDVLTRVAELAYQGKLNSETID